MTTVSSSTLTRITGSLMASQAINYAANSLFGTVGSIIIVHLAGDDKAWTGVPAALALGGSAASAYFIGRLMDRIGRRPGLTIGHLFGLLGAIITGIGALASSIALFLLGVFALGLSWGSLDLARYAAADASPADRRARALSLVVMGGLAGSLAGRPLIALSETVAAQASLPEEVGVVPLMAAISILGVLVTLAFLRPDPAVLARQLSQGESTPAASGSGRTFLEILSDPRARLAVGGLIFSQLAMVTVMIITPVHMNGHNQSLGDISWVLMAHTIGMTGFSFATGWLADRAGRPIVILLGGVVLSAACIIAPLQTNLPWLAFSLFLLGLGWNFCMVASSSLLDDTLSLAEKGVGQGTADALVKVASGVASLGSGVIFAAQGFAFTSWLTIMFAILPAVLAFFLGVMRRPPSISQPAAD